MLRFVLLVALVALSRAAEQVKLVCYHTNWAYHRMSPVNFTPADIDPNMCTHIIYSFARVDKTSFHIEPYDLENDIIGEENYLKFTGLKSQNPALKTLLAVGGWTHASEGFTQMVKTAANRKIFIDFSITYLRKYGFDGLDLDWEYPCQRGGASSDKAGYVALVKAFDGLDLDWEYPCQRGGASSDKAGYVALVKELREAYQAEADATGQERMLVTMAVPAGEYNTNLGYDVPGLTANLDFVNLMAYDLHGSWEQDLGHHATLFPGPGDSGDDKKLTVSYAVEDVWVKKGCPSNKLIVGLGMYGRAWKIGSSCNINSYANGASTPGPYTGEAGYWGYFEICTKIKNGMTVTRDDQRKIPYACDNTEWVGYDDVMSLYEKAQFIQTRGLGGGMVWALDLDDFSGQFCGEGPWPLMTNVKKYILESGYIPPDTPPTVPTTPTMYPPTTTPPLTFCADNGYTSGLYAYAACSPKFWECSGTTSWLKECAPGLLFDDTMKICNWPTSVPGCG
ncbi:chitotriosidase-1-like [Amphiura filiformis]|uniref:chitotriosidase-1-like n=1 Tax=Amphiura filiformis TaxID=82378 RepID=UPI003B224FE0